MRFLRDKRIILSFILLAVLAGSFWSGSRYPALNEKAVMGGDTEMSGIAFDILLELPPEPSLLQKILYMDVNWMYTNWKGMTFGLLFAGVLMCLMKLVPSRNCTNPYQGAAMGTMMGAPLGVCVNCATPIGQGLHDSGARPAVTLAAITSSPTLNFVVLSMVVTLLPPYMAVLKIGATLLFLFLCLPVLVRFLGPGEVPATEKSEPPGLECDSIEVSDGYSKWGASLRWLVIAFFTNFWLIIRKTVPAMLLAGLLGATIISIFPADSLVEALPGGSKLTMLLSLGIVAAFGIFLPVPIAFDVILVAVLLGVGLPPAYAMVLLFTLGIFSVYPWWVVGRSLSFRLAGGVVITLAVLGVCAGAVAFYVAEYEEKRNRDILARNLLGEAAARPEWRHRGKKPVSTIAFSVIRPQLSTGDTGVWEEVAESISISRTDFQNSVVSNISKLFESETAGELGLDEPVRFNPRKLIQPFSNFRPIASGDIHKDGWEDLVVGSDSDYGGLSVYVNLEGKRFLRQRIDLGDLATAFVVDVALVDVDNDGWLDLFVSTFLEGVHWFRNVEGDFREKPKRVALPSDTVMVSSMAFGDLDRDGDLDGVFGRWTSGQKLEKPDPSHSSLPSSSNFLVWNDPGGLRIEELAGTPGETLATLISDLDQDGWPDVIVGNDFDVPDFFYRGVGDGLFKQLTRADGMITQTTETTMSVISGDVDNDLELEIYLAQIAEFDRNRNIEESAEWIERQDSETVRRHYRYSELMTRARQRRSLAPLLQVESSEERETLMALNLIDRYARSRWDNSDEESQRWMEQLLDKLPHDLKLMAVPLTGRRYIEKPERSASAVPQVPRENSFLDPVEGVYVQKAEEFGIDKADWSWNAKFADLDHNEYQDLLVVGGYLPTRIRETNHYFSNRGGEGFKEQTEESGLTDYLATSAYTYIDFDRDGDLDIITVPIDHEPRVYRNQTNDGASIMFQVRDEIGNRFGVGCRIIVRYGPEGKLHQMREILASGGFLSDDAPMAHFGLGEYEQVDRIEVHWSTGEKTNLVKEFSTGARYTIRREAKL